MGGLPRSQGPRLLWGPLPPWPLQSPSSAPPDEPGPAAPQGWLRSFLPFTVESKAGDWFACAGPVTSLAASSPGQVCPRTCAWRCRWHRQARAQEATPPPAAPSTFQQRPRGKRGVAQVFARFYWRRLSSPRWICEVSCMPSSPRSATRTVNKRSLPVHGSPFLYYRCVVVSRNWIVMKFSL